jgi:glycosyltransferase involved in cell wall biosynthesis
MRVYLEATHTHEHNLKTGIQRVVRKLGEELDQAAAESGVSFSVIVSDPKRREHAKVLDLEEFITGFPKHSPPPLPEVAFKSTKYLVLKKIWRVLRKIDFLNILGSELFKRLSDKIIGGIFLSEIRRKSSAKVDSFKFEQGDILLVADAFWAPPYTTLSLVSRAKTQGAKIIFLINDIFPVSNPEFVDPPNVVNFTHMISDALQLADAILYPSIETKKALEKGFFPDGIKKPHQKIFYGADSSEAAWIFDNVKRRDKSILMVGTIEPRKNHRLVLKWFLSLAKKDVRLTFIGKNGWLADNLINAMNITNRSIKNFSWIEGASDDEVTYQMLKHEVGIMASHAEGLGLPVLEYSRHGLKLVLNDIPIFREVAGDAAFYFDGSSIESLDQAILNAFAKTDVVNIPEVSWRQTANEVMGFVLKHFASKL